MQQRLSCHVLAAIQCSVKGSVTLHVVWGHLLTTASVWENNAQYGGITNVQQWYLHYLQVIRSTFHNWRINGCKIVPNRICYWDMSGWRRCQWHDQVGPPHIRLLRHIRWYYKQHPSQQITQCSAPTVGLRCNTRHSQWTRGALFHMKYHKNEVHHIHIKNIIVGNVPRV